jgi:hypothetical protein
LTPMSMRSKMQQVTELAAPIPSFYAFYAWKYSLYLLIAG